MSTETKTLPTIPGWYVQDSEPLTEISTIFLLNNLGDWWDGHLHFSEEEMLQHYAPLTRLVMETDSAQHPEVDVEKALMAFKDENNITYQRDFESTLRRVLEGEFDL